jgi:hypothetical protein
MLSRLGQRSSGIALSQYFETAPVLDSTFGSSVSSYVLLFGWQGVLPILVIAVIFGILVRIQRLSEIYGPYFVAAIGIIGIVIWVSFFANGYHACVVEPRSLAVWDVGGRGGQQG